MGGNQTKPNQLTELDEQRLSALTALDQYCALFRPKLPPHAYARDRGQ